MSRKAEGEFCERLLISKYFLKSHSTDNISKIITATILDKSCL